MNKDQLVEFYEDLDENEIAKSGQPSGARTSKRRLSKRREMEAQLFVRAQEMSRELQFTYKAARFEEVWLWDSLRELAENKWIDNVLRKVKGGKEASVYLCKPGPSAQGANMVAAKVYRPRMLRNLKDDHEYREGRVDLDGEGHTIVKAADLHAMAKRTGYGEELRHQSWIAHEFQAMQLISEAGADVPRPYALTANAILMDFVGDELGSAPTLNEVALESDEAHALFKRVLHNIDILLASGIVHGDLSAYNILYWDGSIRLIDFPQVVPPTGNRNAFAIFSRDVARVCDYFAKQGVTSDPARLARDLWTARGFSERQAIHPRWLDPEDQRDRSLWQE